MQRLVAAHIAAVEALGKPEPGAESAPLFRDEAGDDASKFLTSLRTEEDAPDMRAADYPAFYRSLAEEVTVQAARTDASAHLHLGALRVRACSTPTW